LPNPSPIQFEAVKAALKQSKDGYVLTLAVHPDDLPDDLMRDFVGSRYVVVMVRLGDDEQPMNRENEFPGDFAVKMAGILCRDPDFWEWLHKKEWLMEKNEKACAEWLISYLDIESRKELKTNIEARDLFVRLKTSFDAWRKS
jgi:hypothetical protein